MDELAGLRKDIKTIDSQIQEVEKKIAAEATKGLKIEEKLKISSCRERERSRKDQDHNRDKQHLRHKEKQLRDELARTESIAPGMFSCSLA